MANAVDSLTYGGNTYVLTIPYGTCGTAAGTAVKTVSVTNFSLETGARVSVKFTYANSVASPTLNVNSTGAKNIYWHGAALTSDQYWQAGAVLDFVYNGTQWEIVSVAKDNNTTYSAAGSSLGLVKSGGDVTISDGVISVADDSHNHVISNIDGLQSALDGKSSVSFSRSLTSGTKVGTITINGTGTDLYAPTNTDTHYSSKNVVGGSTATSNTTSALGNGAVYLNSVENGAVTSSHKISGSGATTVKTDTSGNIVISSTDNNTTYGVVSTSADGLAPKRDGSTSKFLRADGTWAVPPDTNTTYSLSSFGITATSTELNYCDGVTSNIQTQLDGKAANSHDHDDMYYTESEMNTKLNAKFNTSGGTVTGATTFSSTVTIGSAILSYDSTDQALVISFA